jgi:regulator of PEP synthase PpsR (kinase-PPPase family)
VAFSPVIDRLSITYMAQTPSYFHLHLISDATGETLITVARAAAAQYAKVMPVEHVHPLVRTQKQLDRVLAELEESPGIVLYTLLEDSLVKKIEDKCSELGLPCLSILGPVLHLFQSYLGGETTHKVGAQHTLNAEYFRRIDALNYTMMHDDGQLHDDLEEADVVLVGVSRTSKTPTSIYLANRGVKTANVPMRQALADEIAASRRLCAKHNWPLIDVTRRSIEETAAAVLALLGERRRHKAS